MIANWDRLSSYRVIPHYDRGATENKNIPHYESVDVC